MKLFGDYHTHTTASDGHCSIEENVVSAVNKGIKQIAITDHSFSHMSHGLSKKEYEEQSKEINQLKNKYSNIEILHGVESNLMSLEGDIDVKPSERSNFDIVNVGYHLTYKPLSFKNFFNFWLPSILGIRTKKRIQKNTMAYINAMNKNDIDILVHLNYGIKVDVVEIAKVAKEKEVYIELNAKHLGFKDDEILNMVKTGVKFVINSDAHKSQNIAKNNRAFALIERLNLPTNQIVNLNDVPKFKNYNMDKKY